MTGTEDYKSADDTGHPGAILAMDTAGDRCSVAVHTAGATRAYRGQAMRRGHAEALVPMILETLAEADTEFGDLSAFAVSVGPGAFTGLRIGLATARAMALAARRLCLGVTTLEAVAWAVDTDDDSPLLVALETKRDDLYTQVFDGAGLPLSDPAAVPAAAIERIVPLGPFRVAGDAAERASAAAIAAGREATVVGVNGPDAVAVATLAATRWKPGLIVPSPRPLYLRPPDAIPAPNGGRLRP